MKPVPFDYARPASVSEAIGLLAGTPDAKVLAGGQTLGPMLNLRLAQPALLVDVTRIPELAEVREESDAITVGAIVTHAAIEDRRIADPTGGFLAEVATGIAYRAVRTRGTIGGSLAHADPAADWLTALTALSAELLTEGPAGRRRWTLADFMRGAMETALEAGDLIIGIRIPRFSRRARFGFAKICRKTGEFAEAIGAAVHDPERGIARLVASTPIGAPLILDGVDFGNGVGATAAIKERLADGGYGGDPFEMRLAAAALQRAMAKARAP